MIFNGSLKKAEVSNTYAVCELVAAEIQVSLESTNRWISKIS